MTIAPLLNIERDKWIIRESYWLLMMVFMYASVLSIHIFEKITQHTVVYDSHFSTKEKSERCGAIIDYRSYSPIYVMEGKDIKWKSPLKNMQTNGRLCVRYRLSTFFSVGVGNKKVFLRSRCPQNWGLRVMARRLWRVGSGSASQVLLDSIKQQKNEVIKPTEHCAAQ